MRSTRWLTIVHCSVGSAKCVRKDFRAGDDTASSSSGESPEGFVMEWPTCMRGKLHTVFPHLTTDQCCALVRNIMRRCPERRELCPHQANSTPTTFLLMARLPRYKNRDIWCVHPSIVPLEVAGTKYLSMCAVCHVCNLFLAHARDRAWGCRADLADGSFRGQLVWRPK
eukprot:SAG22_NODE_4595_length_1222_cov_1.008014_1_plen_169_part_00